MDKFRILITTVPFGENSDAIHMLEKENLSYVINPIGRKLTEPELFDMAGDYDAIIAGTEIISKRTIEKGGRLKLISRVGIGLDGVDLHAARAAGVKVSYTPDAPSPAAAELTVGLMLSLLRSIHIANEQVKKGAWHRYFGSRLSRSVVGIIGLGRIGSRVARLISSFEGVKILGYDIDENKYEPLNGLVVRSTLEEIYSSCDLITLHVPLTSLTKGMISKKEIEQMKQCPYLVNAARGGVIDEDDLYEALSTDALKGAAIDVFEDEPYFGKLAKLENCLITAHMGSMTVDCRAKMEEEAVAETICFFKTGGQQSMVPETEY
jgi:D-3-phosphoglycerate dehydrogenase